MALYRMYVDEVGNHDMTHADDPNQRFLSLTGVLLESEYTLRMLQPEMDQLKRDFFQRDPDEPAIFHRKELVNKRPPFHPLRDPEIEQEFNTACRLYERGTDNIPPERWCERLTSRELKVKPKSANNWLAAR